MRPRRLIFAGLGTPNATLSASVSENRNGSCGTKPIAPRSSRSGMSRTSLPSMNTVPRGGLCRRGSRFTRVDLPDPVPPTIATVSPAFTENDTLLQHLAVAVEKAEVPELDRARERLMRPA